MKSAILLLLAVAAVDAFGTKQRHTRSALHAVDSRRAALMGAAAAAFFTAAAPALAGVDDLSMPSAEETKLSDEVRVVLDHDVCRSSLCFSLLRV